MEDVELRLVANNKDAVKGIKEVESAAKKLNDTVVQGNEKQKATTESITKSMRDLFNEQKKGFSSTGQIDTYNKKMDDLKKKLSDLAPSSGGGGGVIENVEKSGDSLSGSIFKWGGIVAGFTAVLGLLKSAFESTGKTANQLNVVIAGVKAGFDAIKVAVATLDFKDFNRKVNEAIQEGRRYAEALDLIDSKTRALKIAEANAANALLEQRKIQQSALSTKAQQIAAGKEAIKIEEDLAKIRTGIAQLAYDNELDNITKAAFKTKDINDEMRNQITLYVERDAEFLKGIEIGKEYNQLISKRDAAEKTITSSGMGIIAITKEQFAEYDKLNESVKSTTDEQKKWGEIANNMVIPTEEKYNVLVGKSVDLIQSKGEVLQNTIRIQTKLSSDQANLTKEEQKKQQEDLKLKALMERYTEEYFTKEQKRQKEDLDMKALMERYTEEYFTKEQKRQQEVLSDKERAERYTNEYFDKEKKREEDLYNAKRDLMANATGLGAELFNRQFSNLDKQYNKEIKAAGDNARQKEIIDEKYAAKKNALARKASIAEKIAGLFSVGIDTAKGVASAASKVITIPLIPWIIANGLIQAALIAAKPIPQYAKGGWTGEGKQRDSSGERMAGIVHEREFVVRKGPANKFRSVLEAINRDDKRMILNSFNRLTPELAGSTNNILVENTGPNQRLDQVIAEQKKMNNKEEIMIMGNLTIIKKGNSVRTIRR